MHAVVGLVGQAIRTATRPLAEMFESAKESVQLDGKAAITLEKGTSIGAEVKGAGGAKYGTSNKVGELGLTVSEGINTFEQSKDNSETTFTGSAQIVGAGGSMSTKNTITDGVEKNTAELKITTSTKIPAVQGFGSFELNTDSYSCDKAKLGIEGGASYNLPGTYSLKLDISIYLKVENQKKDEEQGN
ncbi:MAG: hypothetical protein JXA77_14950 [Bacteroidales bacterium]|nr:hypothetical protein [Bacteroidales bacterium]